MARRTDETYLPLRVAGPTGDLVDGPFLHWVRRMVRLEGGVGDAALLIGVDEAMIRRWFEGGYNERRKVKGGRSGESYWHPLTEIGLSAVDRALTNANSDETIWTLYPELDSDLEVDVVYCARCREDVMPVEGVCPWCETPVLTLRIGELPKVAYRRRGANKRKRSLLRTVRRPKVGGAWVPIEPPKADRFKPTQREHRPGTGKHSRLTLEQIRVAASAYIAIPRLTYARDEVVRHIGLGSYPHGSALYQALQVVWRRNGWTSIEDVERALDSGELVPVRKPRRRARLEERLIQEACWRYYYDVWGFDRIARHLIPLAPYYKTYKTLSRALYDEFKFRGWPRRDRIEATRLASFKHGLAPRNRKQRLGEKAEGNYRRWLKHQRGNVQPRCRGMVATGKRKGQRCLRPAVTGQRYCIQHTTDELHARKRRQHLEVMWAHSHASEVPLEPLALWLDEQVARLGTQRAVAERLGVTNELVWALVNRKRDMVRRETVEQMLAAVGEGLTVEKLYEPFLRKGEAA